MRKLSNRLKELNACPEAREWVGDKSLKKAWERCERGDWMLWYYFKELGFTKELVKAKADCASLVKHLMKDQRSLDALQACYDYVDGNLSKRELRRAAAAAADAAYAASAADAVAVAAADAVAVAAADAAAADAAAADAAYAAADAAAAPAAYAAAADARKETLKKCADICREVLTESLFKKVGK